MTVFDAVFAVQRFHQTVRPSAVAPSSRAHAPAPSLSVTVGAVVASRFVTEKIAMSLTAAADGGSRVARAGGRGAVCAGH